MGEILVKKRVGVLTFHKALNYGALFQAYALNRALNNMGHNAEVVDYYSEPVFDIYKNKIFAFEKKENRFLIILKVIKRLILFNYNNIKARNFSRFINNNLLTSSPIRDKKELVKVVKDYDVLITGSDQVWNQKITKEDSDVYMLTLFSGIKKVAYAASIGEDNPPNKIIEELNKSISDYSCVSVREESLKRLIDNNKTEVVLDPTFLLSKEEWLKIAKTKNIAFDYIFVYMLEINDDIIDAVNTVSEKYNLKVVSVGGKSVFKNEIFHNFSVHPGVFLDLMEKAKYVVTNSFHGVCFSLILEKQFITIPHKTRGSRQKDLLKKIGLNNRAIDNKKNITEVINDFIDYKIVNKKLQLEKEKSFDFLLSSIGE